MTEHAVLVEAQAKQLIATLAHLVLAVEKLPADDVRLESIPELVAGLRTCEQSLFPVISYFAFRRTDFSSN